jgi:hypothetical protein
MTTRQSVINSLSKFDPNDVASVLRILKEAKENYRIDKYGRVRSPGKFEGESIHAFYFHALALEGNGEPVYAEPEDETPEDESESSLIGDDFPVAPVERYLMPTLGKAKKIRVTYSDQGFVGAEILE